MSRQLVTGAAGFIGARVAELLLDAGHEVIGIDNLNEAYDRRLKDWRLSRLQEQPAFTFHAADLVDGAVMASIWEAGPFETVFNLAARAGVRASVMLFPDQKCLCSHRCRKIYVELPQF